MSAGAWSMPRPIRCKPASVVEWAGRKILAKPNNIVPINRSGLVLLAPVDHFMADDEYSWLTFNLMRSINGQTDWQRFRISGGDVRRAGPLWRRMVADRIRTTRRAIRNACEAAQ